MKTRILSITVFILLFTSQISISQTTVSIRLSTLTGQSAYIADNYLSTPWPNHPDIVGIAWTVNLGPAIGRTLFRFYLDSIPSTALILDAKLSLFGNPTPEMLVTRVKTRPI